MRGGFIESLDALVRRGVGGLGSEFAQRHAAFVHAMQTPEGGFRGRRGGPDLYYTDFALRTLALLDPRPDALRAAGRFLGTLDAPPLDLADCFNRLNVARLLTGAGIAAAVDRMAIEAHLAIPKQTAYEFFLAALCCELLGLPPPNGDAAAQVVRTLCPDGGFGNDEEVRTSQTNSTAAAVGFLLISGHTDRAAITSATQFIARMQTGSGGFLAHAAAPEPDLLSTFSAIVTFHATDSLEMVNLAATARFLRSLALPGGGFRSCDSDPESDVEYAYYGVATAALLRAHASAGN